MDQSSTTTFSKHTSGWIIAIVFILFVAVVFVSSSYLGYQTLGGYLSPLILLIATWWLYRREGSGLSALGLDLKNRNTMFLPIGIGIGAIFLTVVLVLQLFYDKGEIHLNDKWQGYKSLIGFFFLLQGVLNEELIFRGYCLQKTIARIGFVKANLIFAALFMVWHWISWDAWGQWGMMLISVTTAFGHVLFATAFSKSGTLFFPIGIHLGINWATRYLFSASEEGDGMDVVFNVLKTKHPHSPIHTLVDVGLTIVAFILLILIIGRWRGRKISLNLSGA